jgi:hypothetical protein
MTFLSLLSAAMSTLDDVQAAWVYWVGPGQVSRVAWPEDAGLGRRQLHLAARPKVKTAFQSTFPKCSHIMKAKNTGYLLPFFLGFLKSSRFSSESCVFVDESGSKFFA